jgi:hypothetical protein
VLEFIQSDTAVETAVSSLVTLAAIFIAYWLQGRARLIVFSPNSSFFILQPLAQNGQPLHINSGQVVLQNQGRQPAEEVEIIAGQGLPPAGYNIVPQVGHSTHIDPAGRWTVVLPFIAPKEVVTIQILNGPPIDNIRSKSCSVKYVPVMYQRIYPQWFNALATALFVVGVFSTSYWILQLLH